MNNFYIPIQETFPWQSDHSTTWGSVQECSKLKMPLARVVRKNPMMGKHIGRIDS